MMCIWQNVESRPTRDIDFLGPSGMSRADLGRIVLDCLAVETIEDGLDFDSQSLDIRPIRGGARHGGLRVKFAGYLGRSLIRFQVDVGTGNNVVPEPVSQVFPTLLDFPAPMLRTYTPYTTVAEKFEAIVDLGEANSRMKDYFDLDLLATSVRFEGKVLVPALQATFKARSARLPATVPVGLQDSFAALPAKRDQWVAFIRKSHLQGRAKPLEQTLRNIRSFLLPPIDATSRMEVFAMIWPPGGPWQAPSAGD